MHEDNIKKSRCTKHYRFTAREVAQAVGVSESYVKKVRAGLVATNSHKSQQIIEIDTVLEYKSNKLLQEVERVVKI